MRKVRFSTQKNERFKFREIATHSTPTMSDSEDDAGSFTTSEANENLYLIDYGDKNDELNDILMDGYSDRFSHRKQEAKCLKEKELMALSNMIRRKPNWQTKVFDAKITAKWTKEAVANHQPGPGSKPTDQLKDKGPPEAERDMVYVIAELQLLAKAYKGCKFEPSPVDSVYQSDTAVPAGVMKEIRALATRLETDEPLDWHPNSDEMVRDLVHPSLFAYVKGVSTIRSEWEKQQNLQQTFQENDKESAVIAEPLNLSLTALFKGAYTGASTAIRTGLEREGKKLKPKASEALVALSPYQWMPCDAEVANNGSVKIKSYINNLNPAKYGKEYKTIEKVLAGLIPMFEIASTQSTAPAIENRMEPDSDWWEDEEAYRIRLKMPTMEEQEEDEDFDEDDFNETYQAERIFYPPQAPKKPFTLQFPPSNTGQKSLHGSTIQVIIKMANIHLTPEKPTYNGGSWHVEGELQEKIAASAIIYHEMENITESELSFRASLSDEFMNYEQCDYDGVQRAYGFKLLGGGDETYAATQELGSVVAQQGRTVVFSNDQQHRVRPFELKDKTKPGLRKIMAVFLVNPLERVVSTIDVAPQQREWIRDVLLRMDSFSKLPSEIIERILDFVPGMTTMDEAKVHRLKLMKARAGSQMECTIGGAFRLAYSLCEH
eukprot:m.160306 g.160306  ORF g.160306 m.160306 type:complete len:661 (+) comp31180_c2_seq2:8-1990(+)